MEERVAGRSFAFLRVMMGLWLVWLGLPNLDHSFVERLSGTLDYYAQSNPFPIYRWCLHNIAAPHVEQLGIILSIGTVLVGAALIIGFLGRLSSLLGAIYALNLFLASGHLDVFHQSLSIILLVIFATFMIGDVGQFYGADGFLFKKDNGSKPFKPKFKDKKQKELVKTLAKEIQNQSAKKDKKKKKTKASAK